MRLADARRARCASESPGSIFLAFGLARLPVRRRGGAAAMARNHDEIAAEVRSLTGLSPKVGRMNALMEAFRVANALPPRPV